VKPVGPTAAALTEAAADIEPADKAVAGIAGPDIALAVVDTAPAEADTAVDIAAVDIAREEDTVLEAEGTAVLAGIAVVGPAVEDTVPLRTTVPERS
jgi:hypothetical protein